MDIIHETATSLLQQLDAGSVSSVEVTTAFLDQIENQDTAVGAFLAAPREVALATAAVATPAAAIDAQ